jgi:hypothetical protein
METQSNKKKVLPLVATLVVTLLMMMLLTSMPLPVQASAITFNKSNFHDPL